jgi:hypothetical protein
VVMWQRIFSVPVMLTVWRREMELPEDDLIEDLNMLQCFLKCFK